MPHDWRCLAGWIGLCLACVAAATGSRAAVRPNVILLMADDLGWGDVGFNGNRVIQTPHLDRLARDGVVFERFYAAAPVCSPTRGSALTGRHPHRYGIHYANDGHLPEEEVTLAELLRDQGYVTGHFGKWHLGTLTRTETDSNRGGPRGAAHFSPPARHGFDVVFSTEAKVPTWDPMVKPRHPPAGGRWWHPVDDPNQRTAFGTAYWNEEGEKVLQNLAGDDSRVIMDRAVDFIRDAVKRSRPFLAVVWFHAPHLPVVAGPADAARYKDHEPYARHYFGCITAMDEQVGRLTEELARLGVADRSMVWFASDNGPEGRVGQAPGSAGPFRGRKRSLLEGGIRVPAFLVWPGRVSPRSVARFHASTSDYLPTLLDVLDLPMPDRRPLDGTSLLPFLDDPSLDREEAIGFESRGQLAWLDRQYKLLASAASRDSGASKEGARLYDLENDPGESRDLANRYPERVAEMRHSLQAWRASCRDSRAGKDYPLGKRR